MKRERGGAERERSGITSLRKLPEGEIRALGTDEGRDLFWKSGICGHDNSDKRKCWLVGVAPKGSTNKTLFKFEYNKKSVRCMKVIFVFFRHNFTSDVEIDPRI
jgi:hypothetical protein